MAYETEFTNIAMRNKAPLFVNNDRDAVGNRSSDGNIIMLLILFQYIKRGADCKFRRAIAVDDFGMTDRYLDHL